MWKGVRDYTKSCDTCERVNQRAGKVVSLLKPLPVTGGRWECVGVYFITDIPTFLRGNDYIVIIMDNLSKRYHWLLCAKTMDSAEFAKLLLKAII
jgi:hypothetical protein